MPVRPLINPDYSFLPVLHAENPLRGVVSFFFHAMQNPAHVCIAVASSRLYW